MKKSEETLVLLAEMGACFGGKVRRVELNFTEGAAVLALASADGQGAEAAELGSLTLEEAQARQLVGSILRTFDTPQSLGAGRSTNVYKCDVKWKKDATTTEWSVQSSEPERAAMLEVIPQLTGDRRLLAERVYANYRNWAHDLMDLADSIVASHRDRARRAG